jgi:hypothetical protein
MDRLTGFDETAKRARRPANSEFQEEEEVAAKLKECIESFCRWL